ncbi:MAG: DUF1659 domain-containing protein [Firmicutes bacterium]|jgi:hypothetical protein|nr:DUF1659 domain-containing protein [Bacillota bacterium]
MPAEPKNEKEGGVMMAVVVTPSDSRLQIKFQTGVDENGNPVVCNI